MNSEKVKEIKKGLECCSTLMDNNATSEEQDNSCNECPYRLNERCSWKLDGDALTLINELESENDTLHTNLCELRKETQQLKNRIAEFGKEIEENASYVKGYADGIKNTYEVVMHDKLKQFAEKLKNKLFEFFQDNEELDRKISIGPLYVDIIGIEAKDGTIISLGLIDETLKEYEK